MLRACLRKPFGGVGVRPRSAPVPGRRNSGRPAGLDFSSAPRRPTLLRPGTGALRREFSNTLLQNCKSAHRGRAHPNHYVALWAEPPKQFMKTRHGIAAAVAACALISLAGAQSPPDVTNAPAGFDTNAEPKVVQPAKINLSPELGEVVRLAQSGADENVIITYIQKTPAYSVSADEVIYLQDLGISGSVIKAVVEQGKAGAALPANPPATNAPSVLAPGPMIATSPPPVVATPPVEPPATVAEFYQPLSPYGTWLNVEPYGWCWQPNVVVVNSGWSPYCDNGYWLWSDSGWYWHSYYSWGWAPFHYGRWFYHPHRHWVWLPDRVWGPSWLCWRETPGYYGWAPLPPGAHFSVGLGWTFGSRHVGPDFAFGLSSAHFTFVAGAHFTDHHLAARRLPPRETTVIYNKTTVVNNYTVGSGNRIINRGVERSRVEASTGTRFHEVAVKEMPRDAAKAGGGVMPDRVTKVGRADVVYKPGPRIEVPRKPAPTVIGQRETMTRPDAPTQERTLSVPPKETPGVRPVPKETPRQPIVPPSDANLAKPQVPNQTSQRVTPPAQPTPRQVAPPTVRPAPAPRLAPRQFVSPRAQPLHPAPPIQQPHPPSVKGDKGGPP